MTRKEQIENAAKEFKLEGPYTDGSRLSFIAGCEWADQNPQYINVESVIKTYDPIIKANDIKIRKVLEYCQNDTNIMWAASIVGILLDCDFREAREKLRDYLSTEKSDEQ